MSDQPKKKKSLVRRILKWTGITFLLLIIFIIAAPFLFKNQIVQYIKDTANANMNAKVDFGDFDLTLFSSFPEFTLSINNVSVANVDPFGGDTLFSTKNLTLTLNLMSVIKGDQYKIRTVILDHPRIFAKVMQNGKANWDIAKVSTDTVKKTETPSVATKFKLNLKKLEIKDAHIIYDDASLNTYAFLDDLNYTLTGDFTQDNFILSTEAAVKELTVAYGGVKYMNKVKTDIKINLDADMPNFKFTFKDNSIALNELNLGIDGSFAMPDTNMNMDMKFKATQSEFKNFLSLIPACYTKDFSTVKTSGKLAMDGFVKGTYNAKVMPAFGAHIKIDDAMFQYPSLPASAKDITVDVNIDNPNGDPDKTIIDIKKFHVELAGNPIDASMHVETPISDPYINGQVLGRMNLATLKTVVPMEADESLNGNVTADVKMNGHLSSIEKGEYDKFKAEGKLIVMDMNYKSKANPYDVVIKSMTLNFAPNFIELAGFDSKIGNSDIAADGKIENLLQYYFKNQLLKGTFNMRSNVMDLNQFMATAEPSADPNAKPAPVDTASFGVVDVPGNVDFVMNTKVGKLIYETMNITDVSGMVAIKDKKVDLTNLKMNMLDGGMVMNGYYETKDITKPSLDMHLIISDFDIPSTFKTFVTVQKLAPVAQYTKGHFSTDIKLNSILDKKMEPVMTSLNGEGTLQTKQVTVSGFEPLNKLADALKMDKFKKADFSDLKIHFKFKDGKVSTDEFPFKSGSIAGSFKGSTAYDQTIDYAMKMEIPTKDMPNGAKEYVNGLLSKANMLGVNAQMPDKVKLNALFGGTVLKPTVKTDVKEIQKEVTKDLVDKGKEIIKEKKDSVVKDLKKDASAEAEKILKDAQVQADQVKADAKKLSEDTKKAGYDQAQQLEDQAKNPLAKIAAKKAADKLRKETDDKSAKIVTEGDQKADDIMKAAHEKADKLK